MPAFSSEGKVSILELMPRGFQRPADNPNAQASQPLPEPPIQTTPEIPTSPLGSPQNVDTSLPSEPDYSPISAALADAAAQAIVADVATGVVWLRGECAALSPEDKKVVLKIIMQAIKRAHDDKLQRYADEFAMQQDGREGADTMQESSGTGESMVSPVLGLRTPEE